MKKILSLTMAYVLLFICIISVSAADVSSQKEEVVYGILNLDGTVKNLYVVNIFNESSITDYGNYHNIRNMTTSEKLSHNGERITINTHADRFYYQGTLEKKELPWDIAIKYFLDGRNLTESELAGKSGNLKISMSVKQNNKMNSTFFDNYALQITISLNNKLSSNIKADNATVAEAGSKKQLTYTVLPGKGIDIEITADVRDFEMEAIAINGIRLSLDIKVDSNDFQSQLIELVDAIKKIDNGAAELLDGINQLSTGMQKYTDGMKAFKDGFLQLSGGADKLNTGAAALENGLNELTKHNDNIINGALAIQQATFNSVNEQLNGLRLGLPVLTPDNYSVVLSLVPKLVDVKKKLDGTVQFTQGLQDYMDGVVQLRQGASDLSSGTAEFKASTSVMVSSANDLYEAGEDLNAAVKNLRNGIASYKDGTKELRNGTSDMGSEINNMVDEILRDISGSGDNIVSFVSDKNTNVLAVQFVLKTDSINIPETPKTIIAETIKLNFWQKLLNLFGLYK